MIDRYDDAAGAKVSRAIAGWIPALERLLDDGTIKPVEYLAFPGVRWDRVISGLREVDDGKTDKKMVVEAQQP